jgi:hypothetical protein
MLRRFLVADAVRDLIVSELSLDHGSTITWHEAVELGVTQDQTQGRYTRS